VPSPNPIKIRCPKCCCPILVPPELVGGEFAFAGLWETCRDHDGNEVEACALLTTEANDRMPVILDPRHYAGWLDPHRPRSVRRLAAALPGGRHNRLPRLPVRPQRTPRGGGLRRARPRLNPKRHFPGTGPAHHLTGGRRDHPGQPGAGSQASHDNHQADRQGIGQPGVGRLGPVFLVLVMHDAGVGYRLLGFRHGDRLRPAGGEGVIDGG
jgi:hypothetical protein